MIEKRKLLYWEGSSKKDFKEFPVPVQKDMGVSLFVVQLGGTPDSAKPWKGLGSGVYELVEDHRGDTFRAVYTVKIGDAVHVLHAFQKKSKSGIATPQPDVELIEKRLKAVLARYAANRSRKDTPQGTDNVLLDLGFDDAEELSAKAALALKLNELIDQRDLSQTEAAHITGMTQPKVSQVRRYKLQNISLERLMQALVSLDQHVEIVVQPARHEYAPGITVAA